MAQLDQKSIVLQNVADIKKFMLESATASKDLDAAVESNIQKLKTLTTPVATTAPTAPMAAQHYDLLSPEEQARVRAQTDANIKRVDEINDQSWQQTHERGTALGVAKNAGAHIVNLATTAAAFVPELSLDTLANVQGASISDEASELFARKQAYNQAKEAGSIESTLEAISAARIKLDERLGRGEIDQEEYGKLRTRIRNKELQLTPLTEAEQGVLDQKGDNSFDLLSSMSAEQRLQMQASTRNASEAISDFQEDNFDHTYKDDLSKLVEKGNATWDSETIALQRKLGSQQLQQGDYIGAASNLIESTWNGLEGYARGIGDNKEVAVDVGLESAAETMAYLRKRLGNIVNVAVAGSDASDAGDEGIAEFIKLNGRPPRTEERAVIMAGMVAYGGVDFLSTKKVAKAVGLDKSPKVVTPSRAQVVDNLLGRATTGVKATAKRVGKVAALTGTEVATGTFQGVLEQTALTGDVNAPVNSADVVASAVLEGLGGGVAGGAKPAIGQTIATTKGVLKEAGIVTKVLLTGNPTNLASDHAKKTTAEQKDLQLKSNAAVESGDLSTILDENDPKFDSYTAIDTIARRLQSDDISDAEKETLVEQAYHVAETLDAEVDTLKQAEQKLADQGVAETDKRRKKLLKDREVAQGKVDEALGYAIQMVTQTPVISQEEVKTTIDEATQAESASDDLSTKVDRVISSAMMMPNLLDKEQATTLSKSAGVTGTQKTYLESFAATEETLEEAQTIDGVSKDIFHGNPRTGMRGLAQYRVMVSSALSSGNASVVTRMMGELASFSQGHTERAKDFSSLLDLAKNGASEAQLSQAHVELNAKYPRAGEGKKYAIRNNFGGSRMVTAMLGEAKAIQTVLTELSALGAVAAESGKVEQEVVAPWVNIPSVPNVDQDTASSTADASQTVEAETIEPTIEEQDNSAAVIPTDVNVAIPTEAIVTEYGDVVDATDESDQQLANEYFGGESVAATTESVIDTEVPPWEATPETEGTLDAATTTTPEQETPETSTEINIPEPASSTEPATLTMDNGDVINEDTGEILVKAEAPPAATGEPPTNAESENTPSTEQLPKTTEPDVTLETVSLASKLVGSVRDVAKRTRMTVSKSKAPRLLQNVSNVFTNMTQGTDFVKQFTSDGKLTRKQAERTLAHVSQYVTEDVIPAFDKIFDVSQSQTYEMLVNEDGSVDENVKGAFGVAAYNWMTVYANRTLTNKDEDINSLIGRPTDTPVESQLRNLLINLGSKPDAVAEVLGRDVAQALGINFNKKSFDNEQRNAEIELGHLAINIMAETGLVTIDSVTGKTLDEVAPINVNDGSETLTRNPHEQHFFVRARSAYTDEMAANGGLTKKTPVSLKSRLGAKAATMVNSVTDTGDIISQLFGTESRRRTPSLSPITSVVPTLRRSPLMELPQRMKNAITRAQQVEWTIKQDVDKTFSFLSKAGRERVAGVVASNKHTHADNLASIDGRNEGIRLGIEHYNQFKEALQEEGGAATPFFFRYFASKQSRTFIDSNTVNPQNDKNHRHLVGAKSWTSSVPVDESDPKHVFFRLAIGQAFGIKIDGQPVEKSLAEVKVLMQDKDVLKAVNAVRTIRAEATANMGDRFHLEDDLFAGLEKLGGNMHALDGLHSLASYLDAVDSGSAEFTTDIAIEVDGKTNGPAIALMQLGAFSKLADLEKFGIFTDGTSDYTEWYADKNNLDAYESLAAKIDKHADMVKYHLRNPGKDQYGNMPSPAKKKFLYAMSMQMPNIRKHLGEITRQIAKDPTMQTIYGAGEKSISNSLSNVLIDNFRSEMEAIQTREYKGLSGIAVQVARGRDAIQLVSQINSIFYTNAKNFPAIRNTYDVGTDSYYPDYTGLLGYSFDNEKEKAIRQVMEFTYGEVFNNAIASLYSHFFEPRDEFNRMLEFTNFVYVKEYNRLVNKRVNQLTDPKHKSYHADFDPEIHDLPREDIERIEGWLLPIAPTVSNVLATDTEGVAASIDVGKSDLLKTDGKQYKNYADLAMPGAVNSKNKKVKFVPKTYTARTRVKLTSIGVGPAVLSTQMMDNGNAIASLEMFDSLSVFDGHYYSLNDIEAATLNLNKAFLDQNQGFSYVADAQKKYLVAQNMLSVMERNGALDEKELFFITELAESIGSGDISRNTSKREELFSAVTGIHQYVFPGITYSVNSTADDATDQSDTAVEKEVESIQQEVEDITPASEWGDLGPNFDTKNFPRYKALESFLEKNPITDALTVLERMAKGLSANNRSNHNKVLGALALQLSKIKSQVPIEIYYVQPNTKIENERAAEYLRNEGRNALAFTQTTVGEPVRLYIKSGDFAGHGTNQSTVLHEIVHAYTVAAIMGANPPKQVRDAKAQLEKLRQQLIKDADQRGQIEWSTVEVIQADGSTKEERVPNHVHYANALVNISELVAWGMTDKSFQDELSQINVKHKGKFKHAFDSFVDTVRDLLGMDPNQRTALEDVIDLSLMIMQQQSNPDFDANNQQYGGSLFLNQERPKRLIGSLDVFKGLSGLSPLKLGDSEETRLEGILASIEQGIPLFETYVEQANETVSDVADQYYDSLINGNNVFSSRLRESGMPLTTQELYVAEQIEVSTRAALQMDVGLRKEVQRMFAAAKQQLPLSAFADPGVDIDNPANKNARERAIERRNAVFNVKTVSSETTNSDTSTTQTTTANRSDYLARFVALGMVHAPFRDALVDVNLRTPDAPAGTTIGQRLQQVFNQIFEFLGAQVLRNRKSLSAQRRLDGMFSDLAGTRVRQQSKLVERSEQASRNIERTLGGLSQSIKGTISKAAGSSLIQGSSQAVVRSAGMATQMATGKNPEQIIQTLDAIAKPYMTGKQGIIGELWTELKGQNEGNVKFYEQLRKSKHRIDQGRQHIEDATKGAVDGAFSRELTEKERVDLTKVVIKLDLVSLLDTYDLQQIDQLLRDPKALKAEINKLRKRLNQFPLGSRYRQDAHDLGYYLATESSASDMLLLNAHNIAHQAGRQDTVSKTDALKAEPIINKLATLHGIAHTDLHHRESVSELIREENQAKKDTGDNGVTFVMNMHKAITERAKSTLFMSSESMMIKGYSKDTVNPHASLKVVQDLTDPDLAARGYTQVESLAADRTDPVRGERYLVLSDSDKMVSRVTGAISFTSRKRKGNSTDTHTKNDTARITANKQQLMASRPLTEQDPSKARGAKLVPVFNDRGVVVSYRYLMSAAHRDKYLERNNDIGEVLSSLGSSVLSKTETKAVNEEIIEALALDFRDSKSQPGDFVIVGANSTDKELREIWKVLPQETKDAVRTHFGGKDIHVRRDMVRIMFGFKQPALVNLWDMEREERDMIQNMIVTMFEHLPYFSKHTIARMRKTGEIWDEMIKETKDILVIKSGMTLLGNFISNLSVLYLAGVPLTKMGQLHKEGYNGIVSYQRDTKELTINQAFLVGNPTMSLAKRRSIEERIAVLEDDIAANPVRELVEAGAMSTIVEDIDGQIDPFSYKSKLTASLDARTQWIPQVVKTGAGVVTMSRNTKVYKVLNHSTQVSDFVARYAMYTHVTQRKRDPMSKRDAVNEIMETFVQYDIPTNKYVEYLNKKGFLMFTKYYMRIQSVIVKRMRKDPGRVLSLAISSHFFDFWNILESSFLSQDPLSRLANPAELLMAAPGELLTLQVLD